MNNLPYRTLAASDSVEVGAPWEAIRMGGSPIIIGADVPLSEGATRALPTDTRYADSFRKTMAIDEIRFIVRSPDVSGYTGFSFNWAASVKCEFRLGRIQLSSVPVPVCMFNPDILQDPRDFIVTGTSTKYAYSHWCWRLPRPLLVRANTALIPMFTRRNDGYGGTANVHVAVVGRVVHTEIPKAIPAPVPHVGFFETPQIIGTVAGTGSAQSTENDFNNPYPVPLFVQRFVARQETKGLNPLERGLAVLGQPEGNLTFIDPDQNVIVSTEQLIPVNRVFYYTAGFPIYRAMEPGPIGSNAPVRWRKKNYTVRVDNYSAFPQRLSRVMVSMVGWRMEVL